VGQGKNATRSDGKKWEVLQGEIVVGTRRRMGDMGTSGNQEVRPGIIDIRESLREKK